MEFLIILFVVIMVVAVIAGVKKGVNEVKALNRKKADLGAKDVLSVYHIEGLGLGTNTKCDLFLLNDRILIDAQQKKFEVSLSKIRAAEVKSERELIEKGKSVVGRAIIGTLLVPGLGTIVGGMSGIGTKKKKGANNHFLILNYTDSKGELQAVTFLHELKFVAQAFSFEINKLILSNSSEEIIQL